MTEKLYYRDSHIFTFGAKVLACEEGKKGYEVILDATAFFPEGGGQRADTGRIAGVRVLDVHERDGEVIHYTDGSLKPGTEVHCALDAEQRLRRMQNHSGEHVFSGLVHQRFGYENVGFHMGEECMTIDFSGELGKEDIAALEQAANEVVRQNLAISTFFPAQEELAGLEYRSKLELTHDVRIVEIPGVDRCACCAPHVYATGEIGIIKVLDAMRHRGGMRISLVCGMDALDTFRLYQSNVTAVSNALSVKRPDTGAAVERVLKEKEGMNARLGLLSAELAAALAAAYGATEGNICVFNNSLTDNGRRELCNRLMEKCRIAAVFCGEDGQGYRYIIGSRQVNLRQNSRAINAGLNGKGGGSPEMLQGTAAGDREMLQKFIESADF